VKFGIVLVDSIHCDNQIEAVSVEDVVSAAKLIVIIEEIINHIQGIYFT
jgi:hypothetical protein